MTDLKHRAIVEAIVAFFLLGVVFPELFSAKSTVLVLLGLVGLGGLAAYLADLFPTKSAIAALLREVSKD